MTRTQPFEEEKKGCSWQRGQQAQRQSGGGEMSLSCSRTRMPVQMMDSERETGKTWNLQNLMFLPSKESYFFISVAMRSHGRVLSKGVARVYYFLAPPFNKCNAHIFITAQMLWVLWKNKCLKNKTVLLFPKVVKPVENSSFLWSHYHHATFCLLELLCT